MEIHRQVKGYCSRQQVTSLLVCGRNDGTGERAQIKEIFRRRNQQELMGEGSFQAEFRAGCSSRNWDPEFMFVT